MERFARQVVGVWYSMATCAMYNMCNNSGEVCKASGRSVVQYGNMCYVQHVQQ